MSKWGEEYGFFGGKIEEHETPSDALKREIKEELGIEITDFQIFKHHYYSIKEADLDVEVFCFIANMPQLNLLNVQEGELAKMKYSDSLHLKLLDGDKELLKEFGSYLEQNRII